MTRTEFCRTSNLKLSRVSLDLISAIAFPELPPRPLLILVLWD